MLLADESGRDACRMKGKKYRHLQASGDAWIYVTETVFFLDCSSLVFYTLNLQLTSSPVNGQQ